MRGRSGRSALHERGLVGSPSVLPQQRQDARRERPRPGDHRSDRGQLGRDPPRHRQDGLGPMAPCGPISTGAAPSQPARRAVTAGSRLKPRRAAARRTTWTRTAAAACPRSPNWVARTTVHEHLNTLFRAGAMGNVRSEHRRRLVPSTGGCSATSSPDVRRPSGQHRTRSATRRAAHHSVHRTRYLTAGRCRRGPASPWGCGSRTGPLGGFGWRGRRLTVGLRARVLGRHRPRRPRSPGPGAGDQRCMSAARG